MTTTTGLTFSSSTSGTVLSFTGSKADINSALATLRYNSPDEGSVDLEATILPTNTIYNPSNGHMYQVVSVPGGITWDDAVTAAAGRTLNGSTGYLATITTQSESDFITARVSADGWIGASDAAEEGQWKWMTGPEAGTLFWTGQGTYGNGDGQAVDGAFNNWTRSDGDTRGEPNDAGDEDCAQFYSTGYWNDISCASNYSEYVVEYGDVGNLPTTPSSQTITITASIPEPNDVPIGSCLDLINVQENSADHRFDNLNLTTSIDCTGQTVDPLFTAYDPDFGYLSFRGTFDGGHNTISGLNMSQGESDGDPYGFIGNARGATIKDVNVSGDITGNQYCVGGIVGKAINTTLDNVSFDGNVTGTYNVGGIVGCLLTDKADADASLVDSTSQATILGDGEVGSAIGSVQSDSDGSSNITISGNTTTDATVNKSGNPNDSFYYVGGLIGYLDIENSDIHVVVSDNTVTAPQLLDDSNYEVGGIIGYGEIYDGSTITISANLIDQDIIGTNYVGGVIGELDVYDGSTVNLTDQDYSGNVTAGNHAGGLVGQVYSESCGDTTTVTFERTSYSGTIIAYSEAGGLAGSFDYDCGEERYQIVDSSTSGSILTGGGYYAGGLVGDAYYTDIMNSSSTMDIDSTEYVGGLVGSLEYESSITNSYATGNIGVAGNTEYTGGLVGYAYGDDINEAPLRISESYYSGRISGNYNIGGLVGDADYAIIIQRSYAELTTDNPGAQDVGGLIGYSGEDIFINDSYAEVNIMGDSDLGGLVGRGQISLTDSYANGVIDSDGLTIGGAVGNLYDYSEMNNVFASVDITSTEPLTVGGLIGGMGGDASVVNSYVDGTVSSQGCMVVFGGGSPTYECEVNNTPGAFKGNNETAPMGGIWDFNSVWGIRTADFPCLQWAEESCMGVESDETSATLASAEDGSLITFQQSGCTTINDASTVKESDFHATDPAYSYPVGFVDFNVSGCPMGGQATFTITFTGDFDPAKVTIRKYNSVTHAYSTLTNANSGLVVTKTTLNSKPAIQAVYHITDGGEFDQDGVNGQIFDPIGVGVLTVAAPNTGFSR